MLAKVCKTYANKLAVSLAKCFTVAANHVTFRAAVRLLYHACE